MKIDDKVKLIKKIVKILENEMFYGSSLNKDLFILKEFVKTKSYQRTAEKIGKTRQRVLQLVDLYIKEYKNVLHRFDKRRKETIA